MADSNQLRFQLINWIGAIVLIAVFALAAVSGAQTYRAHAERLDAARELTGGDPDRGRELIERVGCISCHTIPHIARANALVGPPLTSMSKRLYVAGVLPNTPDNMVRWLKDPRSVDSLTAMPNLGLSDHDVQDIAAYLYTLD